MHTLLLTVGDEILLGQIVNTNAAWLGERLALAGADVRRAVTVGDDAPVLAGEIDDATAAGADLIVVTGGLGPTHDDITKPVVAEVFGRSLVFDESLWAHVEGLFAARGRTIPTSNRALADVPDGFEVLPNPKGTAVGLWGEREVGGRTQIVVMMPGVPREMKAIAEASVLPRIRALTPNAVQHRSLLAVGMGESGLAERLGDLDEVLEPGVGLAFLPSLGVVRLRLTARGAHPERQQQAIDVSAARVRERLDDLVFGEAPATLEATLGDLLADRGLTLAVAESCTGGAVAARLTSAPGASRFLLGGVVAYCNGVKTDVLGVERDVIARDGAVSERAAIQMARGVRERLGADIGVSTTGIAGPSGGTPDKPVGTVWLGYASAEAERAVRVQFTTDRAMNIGLTTTAALNLVRRQIARREVGARASGAARVMPGPRQGLGP